MEGQASVGACKLTMSILQTLLPASIPGAITAHQSLAELEQAGATITDVVPAKSGSWISSAYFKVKYHNYTWSGFVGIGEPDSNKAASMVHVYAEDDEPYPEPGYDHRKPWVPLWVKRYHEGVVCVDHLDKSRDEVDLLGWMLRPTGR